MKNSEDHIDKLFRDKLGNQSFDIPDEFMDSLNDQLDEIQPAQNGRTKILFYFLNSLFLIFFLAIPFNGNDVEKERTLANLKADLKIENSEGLKELKDENSDSSSDSSSNIKIKNPKDNPVALNSGENQAKNEENLKISELSGNNSQKSTNQNQISTPKNLNKSIKGSKKTSGNLEVKNKSGIGNLKSDDANTFSENKNIPIKNISSAEKNIQIKNESKTVLNSKSTEKQAELGANNVSNSETGKKNTNFADSSQINENEHNPDSSLTKTSDSISKEEKSSIENTASKADQNKINKDGSDKLKLEAQVFGGFNYGGQSLSKTTQSGANFNWEENTLLSPTFGFNVNATLKNISLGSGIEYFKTGEKFKLNTAEFTQKDSIQIVGYMPDSIYFDSLTQMWDTTYIAIYDTLTVFDTISTSDNWINTYSWISIPLNVGYRFNYGKWAVIPKAGLTFNFGLRNSDGKYYTSSGANIGITKINPVKFNLDYLLQLEIRRSINKFDLYLSPSYRGNLTPMLTGSPSRKHKSFGVRFGVAYQF